MTRDLRHGTLSSKTSQSDCPRCGKHHSVESDGQQAHAMVAPLEDLLSEGLITEGEYEALCSDIHDPEEIEARLGALLGDERGDFDSGSANTSNGSDGRERGAMTEPTEQDDDDLLEKSSELRASFQHFDAERTLVVQRITAVSTLVNAALARVPQALKGEAGELAELMLEDRQEQVIAMESLVCVCVRVHAPAI